jgi:hypothetical protein
MAIGAGTNIGTGNNTGANGSSLAVTPSGTIAVGEELFLVYAADSDDNSDGNSSSVSSVTDTGSNTWAKQREYNNNGDSSASQVVVSIWKSNITTQLTTGSTITVNLAASVHDARAATLHRFTVGAGNTLSLIANATDVGTDAGDLPSQAISSLASKQYLFFRGSGKNARAGTYTPTASHTALTVATADTGGGAASREAVGEFRILTGTGDTSDPTTGDSPTSANVFLAFEEAALSTTGIPLAMHHYNMMAT